MDCGSHKTRGSINQSGARRAHEHDGICHEAPSLKGRYREAGTSGPYLGTFSSQTASKRMTSVEWRKDGARVRQAKKLLDDPAFKEMLAIVRDETPSSSEPAGHDPSDKAMLLGKDVGHRNCIAKILSLGLAIKERRYIEPTYEPEKVKAGG